MVSFRFFDGAKSPNSEQLPRGNVTSSSLGRLGHYFSKSELPGISSVGEALKKGKVQRGLGIGTMLIGKYTYLLGGCLLYELGADIYNDAGIYSKEHDESCEHGGEADCEHYDDTDMLILDPINFYWERKLIGKAVKAMISPLIAAYQKYAEKDQETAEETINVQDNDASNDLGKQRGDSLPDRIPDGLGEDIIDLVEEDQKDEDNSHNLSNLTTESSDDLILTDSSTDEYTICELELHDEDGIEFVDDCQIGSIENPKLDAVPNKLESKLAQAANLRNQLSALDQYVGVQDELPQHIDALGARIAELENAISRELGALELDNLTLDTADKVHRQLEKELALAESYADEVEEASKDLVSLEDLHLNRKKTLSVRKVQAANANIQKMIKADDKKDEGLYQVDRIVALKKLLEMMEELGVAKQQFQDYWEAMDLNASLLSAAGLNPHPDAIEGSLFALQLALDGLEEEMNGAIDEEVSEDFITAQRLELQSIQEELNSMSSIRKRAQTMRNLQHEKKVLENDLALAAEEVENSWRSMQQGNSDAAFKAACAKQIKLEEGLQDINERLEYFSSEESVAARISELNQKKSELVEILRLIDPASMEDGQKVAIAKLVEMEVDADHAKRAVEAFSIEAADGSLAVSAKEILFMYGIASGDLEKQVGKAKFADVAAGMHRVLSPEKFLDLLACGLESWKLTSWQKESLTRFLEAYLVSPANVAFAMSPEAQVSLARIDDLAGAYNIPFNLSEVRDTARGVYTQYHGKGNGRGVAKASCPQIGGDVFDRLRDGKISPDDAAKSFVHTLTGLTTEFIGSVTADEFVYLYDSERKKHMASVAQHTELFNKASYYLQEEILKFGVDGLPLAMAFLESCARELLEMQNYDGMCILNSALHSSAIGRLKLTLEIQEGRSPQKDEPYYPNVHRLRIAVQSDANSGNYRRKEREALENQGQAFVPILALYHTDVTFAKDGNTEYTKSSVGCAHNYMAYQVAGARYNILAALQKQFRAHPGVPFGTVGADIGLSWVLKDYKPSKKVENELYQKSLSLRPRGWDQAQNNG